MDQRPFELFRSVLQMSPAIFRNVRNKSVRLGPTPKPWLRKCSECPVQRAALRWSKLAANGSFCDVSVELSAILPSDFLVFRKTVAVGMEQQETWRPDNLPQLKTAPKPTSAPPRTRPTVQRNSMTLIDSQKRPLRCILLRGSGSVRSDQRRRLRARPTRRTESRNQRHPCPPFPWVCV